MPLSPFKGLASVKEAQVIVQYWPVHVLDSRVFISLIVHLFIVGMERNPLSFSQTQGLMILWDHTIGVVSCALRWSKGKGLAPGKPEVQKRTRTELQIAE